MLLRKEYLNSLERKLYINFTADAGYILMFLRHLVRWQRKSKITLELVSKRNLKSLIRDCLVAFPDTLDVIAKPSTQISSPSETYPSLCINTEINVVFFFLYHPTMRQKQKRNYQFWFPQFWATIFSSICLECNFILKNNMSHHVTISDTLFRIIQRCPCLNAHLWLLSLVFPGIHSSQYSLM